MPVQSMIERVGDDAVERLGVVDARGLAHAVAQHLAAAELALVAVDRRSRARPRRRARCRRAARGRRSSGRRCRRSARRSMRVAHDRHAPRASRCCRTGRSPSALPPRMTRAPAIGDEPHGLRARPARTAPRCRPGCRGACRTPPRDRTRARGWSRRSDSGCRPGSAGRRVFVTASSIVAPSRR